VNQITPSLAITLIFVFAWQLFWKGIALWRAAKNNQKKWFIALTVLTLLNDLGIVPIVFLFFLAKHKLTLHEMTKWFSKKE
jgi:hypothetical protein